METARRNTGSRYRRTSSANAPSSSDSLHLWTSHSSVRSVYEVESTPTFGGESVVEDQTDAEEQQRQRPEHRGTRSRPDQSQGQHGDAISDRVSPVCPPCLETRGDALWLQRDGAGPIGGTSEARSSTPTPATPPPPPAPSRLSRARSTRTSSLPDRSPAGCGGRAARSRSLSSRRWRG